MLHANPVPAKRPDRIKWLKIEFRSSILMPESMLVGIDVQHLVEREFGASWSRQSVAVSFPLRRPDGSLCSQSRTMIPERFHPWRARFMVFFLSLLFLKLKFIMPMVVYRVPSKRETVKPLLTIVTAYNRETESVRILKSNIAIRRRLIMVLCP